MTEEKKRSWLFDIMEDVSKDVETPHSYLYWSLMFAISSAAANSYTLRTLKGNVLYYPNVYIMLLGESGLGKGYPVSLAKRLLQDADITRVIAGRSSIQAIVKEGSSTKSRPGKPVITDARLAIINGELSTAIIADPDALTILTDLYDRNWNPQWNNLLKGDGLEPLKEPYITCLFGSSPAHFYDSIPQPNIEGGYIGRNLVIYEEKRSKELDLIDSESEEIDNDRYTNYLNPKYVPHLVHIAGRKARMIPNEGARLIFNNWRREWRSEQHQYGDRTGFVQRVPDHVLKISMCLALARYDNEKCEIIEADVIEAIEKVTSLIYASQKAAEGTTGDPLMIQTKQIVDFLLANPKLEMTRKELLVKGYGKYDMQSMDRALETLMEMGWVKREKVGYGEHLDYLIKLAGEPRDKVISFRVRGNGNLQ